MPYVDENKTSEVTDIPVATLRTRRVRGGGPPYYKFGKTVRYDLDEVISWARARRALNTADADAVQARLRAEADGVEQDPARTAIPTTLESKSTS
jgi:hypothetical protein